MFKEFTDTLEQAEALPTQTAHIHTTILQESSTIDYGSAMTLPLSDTIHHFEDVGAQLSILKQQLDTMKNKVPQRKLYLQTLGDQISVSTANKEGLQRFASEAVRVRQGARAAGKADRENMGQWCELSLMCT